MKQIHKVTRVYKFFLRNIYKFKPSYFLTLLFKLLFEGTEPYIQLIIPALIVDELIGDKSVKTLVLLVALFVILKAIYGFIIEFLKCTFEKQNDYIGKRFEEMLAYKTMTMDFQYTEDKEILDLSEKATMSLTWYSGGIEGLISRLVSILTNMITLVGVVSILFVYAPWLALVLIVTVLISCLIDYITSRINLKYFNKLPKINRRFGYVFYQLSGIEYGKDIRLYDASDTFNGIGEKTIDEFTDTFKNQYGDLNKIGQADNLVIRIRDFISYVYVGYLALIQRITIGNFTMLIQAINNFTNSASIVISGVVHIFDACNYFENYIDFIELDDVIEKHNEPLPSMKDFIIEFKNVSFKYPKTDKYILKNINLTIKSGQHLSIVGLNGAGKTTLVKVLTRLYDVTEGEILLNGVNIKKINYEDYKKVFATVFQDFKIFAFSMNENIDCNKTLTEKEIDEIISFVGLKEDVENLSHGKDTSLYKMFDEDGTELSGGQAQKVAIARAMAKRAPFIILDEPTAALDPIAEANIYARFKELVGDKTAIYISHRLSSCKLADEIIVFQDNIIQEKGSHEELMKQNGLYQKMFNAQAKYYLEEK